MNSRVNKFFYLLVILLSIFLLSCQGEEETGKKGDVKESENDAVNVEVQTLKGEYFQDFINVIGTVKPVKKASLSFLEGGILNTVHADKGSRVNKGDLIAETDNATLKAAMDAAKARYDLAEMTYEKQEKIFRENVNSEFQMLQAKFNRDQAKADYEMNKARYGHSFIKAPFSGKVDAKFFEKGEYAPPGVPVINLLNINSLKIEAGIPENYVGQVKEGDKALIKFNNLSMDEYSGKVSFVGASVSTSNRTFPVEITLENPGGKIKPEMVAEIQIENKKYENVITVPDEIINRSDEGYMVFIFEDGYAQAKYVDILARFGNKVAVNGGLHEGDKLIVVGYQNLVHGEKVEVVN